MSVSLAARADTAAFAALIPDTEFNPGTADAVTRLPSFLSKIRAAEALAGAPFAETDALLQDALVLRRLGQMVETLRLNPRWAERIAGAGIKGPLESVEQWQAIPIADKQTMLRFRRSILLRSNGLYIDRGTRRRRRHGSVFRLLTRITMRDPGPVCGSAAAKSVAEPTAPCAAYSLKTASALVWKNAILASRVMSIASSACTSSIECWYG
jgi:hypothetical protein